MSKPQLTPFAKGLFVLIGFIFLASLFAIAKFFITYLVS